MPKVKRRFRFAISALCTPHSVAFVSGKQKSAIFEIFFTTNEHESTRIQIGFSLSAFCGVGAAKWCEAGRQRD
jgi:hypothetical protein